MEQNQVKFKFNIDGENCISYLECMPEEPHFNKDTGKWDTLEFYTYNWSNTEGLMAWLMGNGEDIVTARTLYLDCEIFLESQDGELIMKYVLTGTRPIYVDFEKFSYGAWEENHPGITLTIDFKDFKIEYGTAYKENSRDEEEDRK